VTEQTENTITSPLEGIRVVDLSRNLSGPYCTMMLGDMGAEVIKVETPSGGDELRRLYQFPGKRADSEDYFGMFNRNKRSSTLDLKSDEGKSVLRDLLSVSHVFIQNLAPGAVERLGFGWDEVHGINPAMVMVNISGFGPGDTRRAYDGVVQAASGVLDLTGYPDAMPALCGISVADLSSALFAAFATVNALRLADTTGVGRRVDVAMLDSLLALHGGGAVLHLATGDESTRRGCEAPHRAPGNIYPTSEGRYVYLVTNNETWLGLCRAIEFDELVDDPRFVTNQDRVRHREELNRLLAERTATLTTEDLCQRLTQCRVPHSPVATVAEVFDGDDIREREMLIEISGELRGGREPIKVMGRPYRIDGLGPAVRVGPPTLGEANDYVRELIDGLKVRGGAK
jgi:crotonobetainyl-CoA:carnitine CoA-transferase CaiB-like acyl-CoA transferase